MLYFFLCTRLKSILTGCLSSPISRSTIMGYPSTGGMKYTESRNRAKPILSPTTKWNKNCSSARSTATRGSHGSRSVCSTSLGSVGSSPRWFAQWSRIISNPHQRINGTTRAKSSNISNSRNTMTRSPRSCGVYLMAAVSHL